MRFEELPNEIIYEIFDYLSAIDLLRCLFNLNSRFNKLLDQQLNKSHFDFRRISKVNFDYICEKYISSLVDQITSIHLSDDNDTPTQIKLFHTHDNFKLRQFIHLKSISLSCVQSKQLLYQIMIECSYLPCLTHFSLDSRGIEMDENDAEYFVYYLSELSELIYCYLDISWEFEVNFKKFSPDESHISTSLKHLTLGSIECSLGLLNRLLQCMPNLQSLKMDYRDNYEAYELLIPNLSITRLEIRLYDTVSNLNKMLKTMPNLHYLTCTLFDDYINGNQWEEMIRKSLPKLKTINIQMKYEPPSNENKEVQLNEIVESFRTEFWINEYQRFIRCNWYITDKEHEPSYVDIFTLPYVFHYFDGSPECVLTKSTYPYDNKHLICNQIDGFHYQSSYFTDSILSHVRINNIRSLTLTFPIIEQFFSVIPNLDQLNSLCVYVNEKKNLDNIQSDLQFILDRTPFLYSLFIGPLSAFNSHIPFKEITCASVRQLDIRGDTTYSSWYVSPSVCEKQCVQLFHSPLAIQCETLNIKVTTRQIILDLVNNMPNLKALNVMCDDDAGSYVDGAELLENELFNWLYQQLPSTSIISRDTTYHRIIQIWIR
ncbi:unnamed protein product [Adineta steineri]|uniref:F-box domain-containing protein n=1 Tax=Adineta steineri TaxID=433720 RepID=A0A815Q7Q1_9BILA|nr:unnamed protein product [Adineta steineri]CAF3964351.1 unnamed protein product [Adineta steineri]